MNRKPSVWIVILGILMIFGMAQFASAEPLSKGDTIELKSDVIVGPRINQVYGHDVRVPGTKEAFYRGYIMFHISNWNQFTRYRVKSGLHGRVQSWRWFDETFEDAEADCTMGCDSWTVITIEGNDKKNPVPFSITLYEGNDEFPTESALNDSEITVELIRKMFGDFLTVIPTQPTDVSSTGFDPSDVLDGVFRGAIGANSTQSNLEDSSL